MMLITDLEYLEETSQEVTGGFVDVNTDIDSGDLSQNNTQNSNINLGGQFQDNEQINLVA